MLQELIAMGMEPLNASPSLVAAANDLYRSIMERAFAKGLLADRRYIDRPEEPLPAWVVLDVALRLLEQTEPSYASYD